MADAHIGNSESGKISIPFDIFKRHFIALGSSGSGKTVLCKALIEEAARNGIPSIIIDSQGDLASLSMPGDPDDLANHNIPKDMLDSLKENYNAAVFTPSSSKGIPVCINPLKLPDKGIEHEELVNILKEVSNSIASLIDYKADDKGDAIRAFIYYILEYCSEKNRNLEDFDELIAFIEKLPDEIREKSAEIVSEKEIAVLVKKLRLLMTGGKELLFSNGIPIDMENFVKKGQISIFYLNTLKSEDEKHFFVSMLATNLYNWMLMHPSKDLQLIFYIDEVSSFLSAGMRKPVAKDILNLIYKQARKYGVGCVVSTQNPGDIDYKAFAQFNSWAVGRLMTKQDIAKVKGALSSVSPKFSEVLNELPKLKPAEFFLFSPDYDESIVKFKTRYLLTKHRTLTAEELKDIQPEAKESYAEKAKKHETKPKKISKEYIKINISKERLHWIIDKLKKKSFIFFGKKREHVDYAKLLFVPIYFCTARKSKRVLLSKKLEEFSICFDATTGDLVKLEDSSIKRFEGFNRLIELKDIEIAIIRELYTRKRELSLVDFYKFLRISGSAVKSSLNRLLKEGLLMSREKDRFGLYFNINFPIDTLKQASRITERSNDAVEESEFLEEKFTFEELKRAYIIFFGDTEIVNFETIYHPLYEVKLSTAKRSRIYRINGTNGKILE